MKKSSETLQDEGLISPLTRNDHQRLQDLLLLATCLSIPVREPAVRDDNTRLIAHIASEHSRPKGVKPLAIVADLGTDEGVEKTAKNTLDHFGRLDILVNNAAVGVFTWLLHDTDMKMFDDVFRINVRGVYYLTKLLAPALVESKGNIVNISSIVATMVSVGSLPYGMTKAALDHFTRLISLELAPKGVRVNTVNILVNNAAVGVFTWLLHETDMKMFDDVFRINVRGVYYLTKLLAPALVESKGNIVNISSIVATMVSVGSLPYGMTKAALDHFTRLISLELAPKGVRVNTVSPGVTVSEFVKRITGQSEEEYRAWLTSFSNKIPLGEPCVGSDIARMVVHLASDHSRLVTGTVIEVDGGYRFNSSTNTPKGVKPLAIVADLGTDEGVQKIAKETLDHFKRLDVLVNNAGISVRTCIQLADMATFDEVFNVNVRGVYHLTKLLVPALIEAGGNIVNVSSISATVVAVGSLPYGMAKAALDHFTRLVALELAPKGVRVNAVSPGVTVSNIVKRITGYTEDQYQSWLSSVAPTIPMGEVCQGSDIAQMIVHLASDNSRLVTGTVVPVDGGMRFTSPGNLFTKQMK
ncbi:hypothetical protein HW555_004814 [Spodoptera exigua]|uniref:Ketoreductase (KR) domain-containing protein n=1 Tax=Spodoptera exigua TaxID=7107 RepID=A0A835GLC3_SPOEX|nr:hypothetical protein HW555_004814 [Spodoptera exigua]